MATVTETYILEQDEDKTTFPTASNQRLEAAIANGTIVSNSKTPIIDPSQVVAGKTRFNIVRVFKSAADRKSFGDANLADSELQTYLTTSHTRRINEIIS